MMPKSQAATMGAPIFGLKATKNPATISIAPTIRMNVPAPPTKLPSGGQRYMVQSTIFIKNLSRPARIGATTNPQ